MRGEIVEKIVMLAADVLIQCSQMKSLGRYCCVICDMKNKPQLLEVGLCYYPLSSGINKENTSRSMTLLLGACRLYTQQFGVISFSSRVVSH